MSAPMEHRREVEKQQGLSVQAHGLSTKFYKRQLEESETAKEQRKKEQHDHRRDSDKENEGINTRGSGNNYNQQIDHNATQPKQPLSINEYYSPNALESVQQLGRFVQQANRFQALERQQATWVQAHNPEQVAHAQEFGRQVAEMQTAPKSNPSEISNIVPPETVTNPNGKREREALGDITNSSTNNSDTGVAKRARIDNSQIDENSANPAIGEKRKLSDIDEQIYRDFKRIKMEQPEFDKAKMEEEVQKMLHDDKKEEQAKQQGLPPGSQSRDGSPTDPPKHDQKPDKNNSRLQTLQAKLTGEQTQLNEAMSRLGQSDSQQIESLISQIQNAIQTTQREISAAETEKP